MSFLKIKFEKTPLTLDTKAFDTRLDKSPQILKIKKKLEWFSIRAAVFKN